MGLDWEALKAKYAEQDRRTREAAGKPKTKGVVVVGPGRCKCCSWHEATQGHRPDCDRSAGLWPEKGKRPWSWSDYVDRPERRGGAASSRSGRYEPTVSTRDADEVEAWAQAALDDEVAEVKTDQPGTRNDQLNKRALRCFRVAMAAEFDLDSVYDALFDACRANGLIADDGAHSVRATLRSARRGAERYGPAYPDDGVELVDAEEFN